MATTITLAELPGLVGKDLGTSSWIDISQDRIQQFADATDDQQWIHVDPERAKDGPFGAAIAHGFLTLSLTIPLWTELLDVTDSGTKVNYGLNKVRFLSPVKAGSRVRLQATIAEVEEVKGGLQITVDMTIEIEGAEKPAAVAQAIHRFYA